MSCDEFSGFEKKVSSFHELVGTCYHESGHAIVCLLNFIKVNSIFIDTKKEKLNPIELGFTSYEFALDYDLVSDNSFLLKLILSEIYINYGGLAAEKIFYKEISGSHQIPMIFKYGSHIDRSNISNLIKKYNLAPPGQKRFVLKKKLLNHTVKELQSKWSDVRLLSHSLFKNKKLNFEEIKNLLIKKSINSKFWKQQFKKIDLLFKSNNVYEHYYLLMITK